jgi:hypothetical protein
MTYARARLRVGIRGVGTVVVLATAALVLDLPRTLLPTAPGAWARDAVALVAVLILHAMVLAPFDVLGGFVLPRRHGRSRIGPLAFLAGWARGVAIQILVVAAAGATVLAAGRAGGLSAAAAAFVGIMLALVIAQPTLVRLVGGLAVTGRDRDAWTVRADDEGFTGGIVGPPGLERFVVPQHWARVLGPEGLRAARARWSAAVASGSRLRGLVVAVAFNATGFVVAAQWPGADVVSVAGLVTLGLAFTLWSFVGLLVLPSVSRPAVVAADRGARETLGEATALDDTLARLDRMQDDEPVRSGGVETIFHPIPSLARRRAALTAEAGPRTGAWHAARTALFLSWAGLGLLSRAVHCNAGRPQLWVLLPCD